MLNLSQHIPQGLFLTDTYGAQTIFFPLRFLMSVISVTHAETESNKTLEK